MTKRKMYFKMIVNSLIRRRARMIVALLAIAIGATIMSGLVTIYYDIPRQLGKEFRSYGANFVILPAGDEKISEEEFQKVKSEIPKEKIVGMAPYRYETTKINQQPYILTGTDMLEAKKNSPFWYIEGEWSTNNDGNNVMIGKEISKKLNLKIGDSFIVEGPKAGTKVTASSHSDSAEDSKLKDIGDDFYSKKLTVKGIITTGGAEESFIFLPLTLLNEILEDKTNIDGIEASIEADSKTLENLAEKIKINLSNVIGRPVKRVTQSQDIVLGKLQALVLLVNTVVLILTMISVGTTMMAVVAERRKEIGLKKALGATDKEIKSEFLGEGSILGFIGGVLGVGLGFIFAQEVSLRVFGRAINFPILFAPITIIVSMLVTVFSCLYPVKKAIEVDPALVLRGE
ncbi:ABC transporter permease [Fusobacterium russii]|uniref:ABC transporter permease n=1 Tax=Fusobacterium russii TaxID=854 RepID=UPI00039F727B|nr:FtsX-like permease family protein [Fusobacterium russii]